VELKKQNTKKAEKRRKHRNCKYKKKLLSDKRRLVKTLYSEIPKHLCVINHNGGVTNEMPSYFSKNNTSKTVQ
jgi:hypothetical protein